MPPDSDKVRLIAEEESSDRIKSSDTKIDMGKDKKEAKEGDSLKGLNEQELDYLGSRGWARCTSPPCSRPPTRRR